MTARKRKAPAAKKETKSRARTPPLAVWPDWTEAKYWAFLRSALRSAYNKWPAKWAVLKEAKRPYTGQSKQQKWEFQCAGCGKWFKQKDVSVDHMIPAGALSCYEDLVPFVTKLFVGVEGLQVLCTKQCHAVKTAEERNASKEAKEKLK